MSVGSLEVSVCSAPGRELAPGSALEDHSAGLNREEAVSERLDSMVSTNWAVARVVDPHKGQSALDAFALAAHGFATLHLEASSFRPGIAPALPSAVAEVSPSADSERRGTHRWMSLSDSGIDGRPVFREGSRA